MLQTLLIQQVLSRPEWQGRLTKDDLRGLTSLLYAHINPYGVIQLDMDKRIPLRTRAWRGSPGGFAASGPGAACRGRCRTRRGSKRCPISSRM